MVSGHSGALAPELVMEGFEHAPEDIPAQVK